jgi:hypothetical protein
MPDPVMSIVMKAGSLSLRELFARAGTHLGGWLTTHLKSGELRVESADDALMQELDRALIQKLDTDREKAITGILTQLATDRCRAESIEISPTAKAWRNP